MTFYSGSAVEEGFDSLAARGRRDVPMMGPVETKCPNSVSIGRSSPAPAVHSIRHATTAALIYNGNGLVSKLKTAREASGRPHKAVL